MCPIATVDFSLKKAPASERTEVTKHLALPADLGIKNIRLNSHAGDYWFRKYNV